MIAKLIIASLLAGTSTASVGQGAGRSAADGSTSQWPLLYQCTLTVSKLAIKTKGTSAQRGQAGDWDGDGWSRIDLHLAGSPDSSGGPTISAFAIKTKGTGANSGRAGVTNQNPIGVECVKSEVTGDAAAQKATMSSFTFMRADSKGVGWSCSVSGSEKAPQFVLTLLVPTILGQAERTRGPGERSSGGQEDARLESKRESKGSSGGHRASIVPRGSNVAGASRVACSSGTPQGTGGWDVLILS